MPSVKLSKNGVEIAFAIADKNSNFFKLGCLTNPVIPIPLHPRSNYEAVQGSQPFASGILGGFLLSDVAEEACLPERICFAFFPLEQGEILCK